MSIICLSRQILVRGKIAMKIHIPAFFFVVLLFAFLGGILRPRKQEMPTVSECADPILKPDNHDLQHVPPG